MKKLFPLFRWFVVYLLFLSGNAFPQKDGEKTAPSRNPVAQRQRATTDSWTVFTAKDHCFSILMPGRPKQLDSEPIKHKRGDVMAHFSWGLMSEGGSEYGIMYTDRPERETGALDLVEGQAMSISGKLLDTRKVVFQEVATIFSVHAQSEKRIFFAMHLMIGPRLFMAYLVSSDYNKGVNDAQKFHSSFKWICK
ncbi:MAG: hypothetical protein ACREEM_25560 [Blastocatellia bacterium]